MSMHNTIVAETDVEKQQNSLLSHTIDNDNDSKDYYYIPSTRRMKLSWRPLLQLAAISIAVALLTFYIDAAMNPRSVGRMRFGLTIASSDMSDEEDRFSVWLSTTNQDLISEIGNAPRHPRWTRDQANEWYSDQIWLVGSRFIPSYAADQIDMFQESAFNISAISEELVSLVQMTGMNTIRVSLHDALLESDREAFFARFDAFLDACASAGVKTAITLFDSCSDDAERCIPGPSFDALRTQDTHRLRTYVSEVVQRFNNDDRVLLWDIWNHPIASRATEEFGFILRVLGEAFDWIREAGASQPVSSGLLSLDATDGDAVTMLNDIFAALSDVVTFQSDASGPEFELQVSELRRYDRPLICTACGARVGDGGHNLSDVLTCAKKEMVGFISQRRPQSQDDIDAFRRVATRQAVVAPMLDH